MQDNLILGFDIGGTGMKAAIIDVEKGELVNERIKLDTPQPSTPEAVKDCFLKLVEMHSWKGPIGCGFPAIVKDGVACSAANIDDAWIGTNVEELLGKASGLPVSVLNDADAAGMAEIAFGAGKGKKGVVVLITIGSGLGSALFIDEKLVPNTEFGHVYLKEQKEVAERYAANSARKRLDLNWEDWGKRLNEYLQHMERILVPDLIILGGGVSKRFTEYAPFLSLGTTVIPAAFRNNAGALGAAMYAAQGQLSQ